MRSLISQAERLRLEKIRRQKELLEQAQQEASAAAEQNRAALAACTKQLNLLRSRPGGLDDEECAHMTRQLYRHLDNWVKKNFRDPSILNAMAVDSLRARGVESIMPARYLQNSHQRRALIQAEIVKSVCEIVFSRLIFGIYDKSLEDTLLKINCEAKNLCMKPAKHSFDNYAN
ncbi:hypothetical protein VTN77DRAFT_7250 [Rasamsonia byssochlamydoides]|uniref:uncharacterized protein n=1 Tax=Rasamsonia byssochlamydoides TaxID=89139 RepID=UPI0037428A88